MIKILKVQLKKKKTRATTVNRPSSSLPNVQCYEFEIYKLPKYK